MGVDDTPENRAKFESSFPLGKALQTGSSLSYVANAAIYLCSDEAAFVSGVNLPIDGAATVYAPGGTFISFDSLGGAASVIKWVDRTPKNSK
jgi:hypothetical protein